MKPTTKEKDGDKKETEDMYQSFLDEEDMYDHRTMMCFGSCAGKSLSKSTQCKSSFDIKFQSKMQMKF